MDDFFSWVFCVLLTIAIVGCTSCSMFGGGELSDEEFIEAVAAAGCNLKTVKRDDGKVGDISCLETIRVQHER